MVPVNRHNPFWFFIDRILRKIRTRSSNKQRQRELKELLPRKDEIISFDLFFYLIIYVDKSIIIIVNKKSWVIVLLL